MKKLLLLIFLFISINLFSQKEANNWYFGEFAGITFNTNPPTAFTGTNQGSLNTLEGCSSFSKANGDLLFYSDGITVYTKDHQVMTYTNGNLANDLAGNPSSTQSGMIIPKPGTTDIYYLFTVDNGPLYNFNTSPPTLIEDGKGFNVYTINMSLNNNFGQLIDEDGDGVFLKDLSERRHNNWTEKVAAVRGKDCNTYWIVSVVGSDFYSYKIDANGVAATPVISSVNNFASSRGYLKLSPDGTKLAIANQSNNQNANSYVYSFDNLTGIVSNDAISLANEFNGDGEPYGVEFSVDSKKLYISTVSGFRATLSNPATTYKLFQFDLTATNITNSKVEIYTQSPSNSPEGGFRGALQLGPDSKIYATIPLAYQDPDGFAEFLDVIENPTADAVDVIFTKNAINLDGQKATQGLPPFISSLLLPIELTDSSSGQVINNQTLQYCLNDSRTIVPEPVTQQTGTTITYEWSFNDGTTTTILTNNVVNLTLNNITTTNAGDYTLTVTLTDACGNPTTLEGIFTVEVYNNTTATQPSNINFCDTDNDGFNEFDFNAPNGITFQILNNQDPNIFEVAYFLDPVDANTTTYNPTNKLSDPYTNPTPFSNQTIYARVHNTLAPNACFATTSFTLAVTGLPIPQTPTPIIVCDDVANGGDTDGFYNTFRLDSKDNQILTAVTPVNQYNVSYHTTLLGAQTNATTDVIIKNVDYRNTVQNRQEIFVRVENKDNPNCFVASEAGTNFLPFWLIVNPLPVITTPVELKQCDDDTDAFSDFNLTEANSIISANSANETFVYFSDAALTNQIANDTAYRNQTPTNDIVYVRVSTNPSNNISCSRVATVNLVVSTTQIDPTFNRTFNACDDFLDENGNDNANNNDTDGITTFNFSSVKAEVEALFTASGQQITVTFYKNEADALAEQNAITDAETADYRNIGYPNSQDIYVRVDSDLDNGCLGLGPYVTLIVDPVPTAATVNNLELCDNVSDGNSTNGIVQTFNLESQTDGILNGQNPLIYNVTYHLSAAQANSGANQQASPFENTVPNRQTIYVRVSANGCFTDHTTFDVVVNPLPIANPVPDLEICDDDTDGSARNGFSQSINLEDRTDGILGTQNATDFTVTYHTSLALAQSGALPLTGLFTNSVPFRQTIYVRITNNTTSCVNDISNFDVVVNPEPLAPNPANPISNLSECDNEVDLDDTNGIVQNFDLNSQIRSILGDPTVQDEDDFNVTFHISQTNATNGIDPLPTPYTNQNAGGETIYVRIQNKATGCINDDFRFDVIVNPLPDFVVTTPQPLCLNNTPLTLQVENPNDRYTYQWTHPDGSLLGTQITQDVSVGGEYKVTATATDDTMCERTRIIMVNESNIATIQENDVTIVDDNDNNSITINNANNNLGEGDYEFSLLYPNGNTARDYQDSPVFENLEGGIYTILVRDKNGCGVVSLEVSVLEFPKFFTPNNDGFNDTWAIKGANSTFYPESKIYIFNRQGKVMAEIPIDSNGWNGMYLNKQAPSNDYWYKIQLIYKNDTKTPVNRSGHFSLLRK